LIFAQKPDPPSIHLLNEKLISERLCHVMMHEFTSPKANIIKLATWLDMLTNAIGVIKETQRDISSSPFQSLPQELDV
jgi:hypothetical protein